VPVYAEVAQTGHEFAKAAPVLAGTSPESQVALIHDYDSRWAIDFNRFSNRYEQLEVLHSYYKALRQQTQSVDIIAPTADLSRYKLIVAPSLNIVSADLAKTLSQWVERGGHLVLGPRTGMKNEFNALNTQRQPGPLGATLGGRVEQFYALLEDVPVSGDWGRGTATIWAETLAPKSTDVEVLLRYGAGNDWLTDQPAAIRRHVGQGSITYLGALVDASLMKQLAKQWTAMARVDSPAIAVSDRVSVGRRVGQGREVYVMTNFSASAQDIALPESMSDVLNGGETAKVHLPRYGVAVLTRRLR
jgi:beta-galactosidase